MNLEKYQLSQNIHNKQDEVAILARDLAQKQADLADLEAKSAAMESRATVAFVDGPADEPVAKEKK